MSEQPPGPITRGKLDRDRIVELLGDVIHRVQARRQQARIRIVGGSAIALMYSSGRDLTGDLDGISDPEDVVLAAAAEARKTNPDLDEHWLNGAAGQYLPNGFGRPQEWATLYSTEGVTVEVPSAEMLLAMKIDATQRRGRRDGLDLPFLLAGAGIDDPDAAEALYEGFYPGDELTERTRAMLEGAAAAAAGMHVTIADPASVGVELTAAVAMARKKARFKTRPELADIHLDSSPEGIRRKLATESTTSNESPESDQQLD